MHTQRLILSIALLSSLTRCGPTQGYAGPELPKEQVALVATRDSSSGTVTLSGESSGGDFDDSGIYLLPGRQGLTIAVEVKDKPYDCMVRESFNEYGYEACLDDRDKAIRKNKSKIPYCSIDAYTTRQTECRQDIRSYSCELMLDLEANREYLVYAGQTGKNAVETTAREFKGGTQTLLNETKKQCEFEEERTEDVTL